MSEELKPCPFCGGEAEYGLTMAGEEVYCTACYANMPRMTTADEAIGQWNARAERTTKLTYKYTDANGWRERLGLCQCGNLIEVAEFVGEGGNGGYMVVQSSPYCEMCGAKVVAE